MALLDSAALLAACKLHARVPSTTAFPTDAQWYTFLTEAENEIKLMIASQFPNALLGAPVLMTSSDSGYTYTFGVDAGTNAIHPLGAAQIFESLSSIPRNPMVPGRDFLMEPAKIRWLNNQARTFTAGPYARFVTPTYLIDGSTQPTLPLFTRMLMVWNACAKYASAGGQQDPTPYLTQEDDLWKKRVLPALATQYRQQGAVAGLTRAQRYPYSVQNR